MDYCSRVTILLLPDQLLIHRAYLCGGEFNGVEVHFMMSEFHFWHLCCFSEYIIRSKTQCSWSLLITLSFPAQRSLNSSCMIPVWHIWRGNHFELLKHTESVLFLSNWDWHGLAFILFDAVLISGPFCPFPLVFFPTLTLKTHFCHIRWFPKGCGPSSTLAVRSHSATEPRRVSPHLCMLIICWATLSGGGDVEGEKPVGLDQTIPTLHESPAVGPNIALKRQVRRCSHQPQ